MAYDEYLARRIRDILVGRKDIQEKVMFGNLTFTFEGNEALRVEGNDLIVRVNQFSMNEVLELSTAVWPFDKSHVLVSPRGIRSDTDLQAWVERGVSYAATLPPR